MVTTFEDGACAHSCPHDTLDYQRHADEKSTGDRMEYAWQHELMHVMLAEIYTKAPSVTLWAVAHGLDTTTQEIADEEQRVQSFQKAFFMRCA
ncbi:MAG: hypothetical protein NVS9B4_00510 [Candidatus Acidiferrum sp.]